MDEIIDYKLMTSLGVGDDATNTDLLIAALTGPELTSAWTEALANWTDSTPARRGDVRDHVVGLRDHLLHVLADIDNEPEREAVATLFYIGLKSHWMVVNTQFAYQL